MNASVPVPVHAAIDTIIEKESMTCVVIAHRLNTVRSAPHATAPFVRRATDFPQRFPTTLVLQITRMVRVQIKAADTIVVFEEGVVLEQGTHDSLIGAGGLYAQLAGHK